MKLRACASTLSFVVGLSSISGCTMESGASISEAPTQDALAAPVSGETSLRPPSELGLVTVQPDVQLLAASNQLLLGFTPTAWGEDRTAVDAVLSSLGAKAIGQLPAFHLLQIEVTGPEAIATAISSLQDLPGVAYVMPNLVLGPQRTPDPPSEIEGDGIEGDYWMSTIRAYEGWDGAIGDANVPIAVIDTGVALESDHFRGKQAQLIELPDLGLTSPGTDETGHGTAVAALAASSGADAFGSAGVAWQNPLYVVDVTEHPKGWSTLEADLMGMEAALDAGAKILVVARGPVVGDGVRCVANYSLYHEYRWAMSSALLTARERDALENLANTLLFRFN